MSILGTVAFLVFVVELISYTLLIPDASQKPLKVRPFEKYLGRAAYVIAYVLSLLRTPLGLLPYLTKLFIFFVLKIRYDSARSTYVREVINMVGDFVNLGLSTLLVWVVVGPPKFSLSGFILYIPIGAELIRLTTERVPITFSVIWQLIPHRRIARAIQLRQTSNAFWNCVALCLPRYCHYYALSDTERAQYVLCMLKQRATFDEDMANRLAYISAFRIIPQCYGLRSGKVRDVAQAEVFIHATWTNDPWLLVGMAIRRAPWIFDPRYLRRPFYYMTEANRLATLFVLEHARYSPLYAIFQFGHEIRVARLHFFYKLLRWLNADIEEKVQVDGTFQFDQIICWLERRFGHNYNMPKQRYLYTDEEVISNILCRYDTRETISAEGIAARYTYPLKYVEEVLLSKIEIARMQQAEQRLSC